MIKYCEYKHFYNVKDVCDFINMQNEIEHTFEVISITQSQSDPHMSKEYIIFYYYKEEE